MEDAVTIVTRDPILECVKQLGQDSRDEYVGAIRRRIIRQYEDDPEDFFRDEVEIYRTSSLCTAQQNACGRSIHSHLIGADEDRVAQLTEVFWLTFTGEAPE
jgi:hypothetical protein